MTAGGRTRRSSALVAAGLAIGVLVGGGGAAVGATMVTSKVIKNDTIKPVDLNFEVSQDASSLAKTVVLSRSQQEILSTTLTVDDTGSSAVAQGFVELRNRTSNPATVAVFLVNEQDPSQTSSVTTTLKVGEIASVPIGLLSAGLAAGDQTVRLTVGGAPDVVVESAFLSAIASPQS